MFDLNRVLRKNIEKLQPYSSARHEYPGKADIFLDANENSLGSVTGDALNRYPDPVQLELKKRIAEIKGARVDQIFLGNGSDEAIDIVIRTFAEPRLHKAIILPPTYGMYRVAADINDVQALEVPLTTEFDIDLERLLNSIDDKVRIIFICSPNNPTGNSMNREAVKKILMNFNGIVVIDEAYVDFSTHPGWLTELENYPNLIIFQTFSKAWGMASIRLGMAFAHPRIIRIFNNVKYPYNINGVTQDIALKALANLAEKDRMIKIILAERARLIASLQKMKQVIKVFPTDANFMIARFKNAQRVYQYLLENQVIIRDRSKVMHCDGCLRITVGKPEENSRIIELLQRIDTE